MIVIGSNTADNGQSSFTEDVSHFMELRQNRQLALLKRSAKNGKSTFMIFMTHIEYEDFHDPSLIIFDDSSKNSFMMTILMTQACVTIAPRSLIE